MVIADMPPDNVKLLPESKRIFLEIGLKRVIDEHESASEEQMEPLMYNFVKMLCVSRSYLYCSRSIYYPNLQFEQNPDSILVSLASKKYNFYSKKHVSLTYDSVYKLIKLLLPSIVYASFYSSIIDTSIFEKYLEILKLTKNTEGKIGLNLWKGLEKEFMQTLLKTFIDRIFELSCCVDQFETVERFQFPTFDCLCVSSIKNSSQISRVLKCKTKALEIFFTKENFAIEDSEFVDLKNETITQLHLSFDEVNYVNVKKLVEQLRKCSLSLKDFLIGSYFVHQNEFLDNQVLDQVIVYIQRIEDLKACFGNDLTSLSINFIAEIYLNAEHDNTWIKTISENPELKHWKFKSTGKVPNNICYHDTLEMKLDNAEVNLKMTIDVFTRKVGT